MRPTRLLPLASFIVLLAACGEDSESEPTEGGGVDAGTTEDTGSGHDASDDTGAAADASGGADTDGPSVPTPALPSYDRTCPQLSGTGVTLDAGTLTRTVDVYLPDDPSGAGLVFLWHGAGDSPSNFANAFDAQSMANLYEVVVVVPHATGNHFVEWPLISGEDPANGLALADAVVACAADEHGIDPRRIYTTGFSAGALWSARLVIERSDYFAAAVTFSGGYDSLTFDYATPEYDTPVLGTHGGQSDVVLGVNFANATEAFLTDLVADGSYAVICDHGSGHTIPFDPYQWAFPFLFDHSWGEESPFVELGLDEVWPSFCSVVE